MKHDMTLPCNSVSLAANQDHYHTVLISTLFLVEIDVHQESQS